MEKSNDKILAHGEVTGHYHAATAEDAEVWRDGEQSWLEAPSGTDVIHQEHCTVSLPPGAYDNLTVKEFDPFAEEIRNVVD